MCDRIGCTHFPNLTNVDLSGASASRRRFLKGAVATSTIAMAMGMPLDKEVHSKAGRPFKVAHDGQPLKKLFG